MMVLRVRSRCETVQKSQQQHDLLLGCEEQIQNRLVLSIMAINSSSSTASSPFRSAASIISFTSFSLNFTPASRQTLLRDDAVIFPVSSATVESSLKVARGLGPFSKRTFFNESQYRCQKQARIVAVRTI